MEALAIIVAGGTIEVGIVAVSFTLIALVARALERRGERRERRETTYVNTAYFAASTDEHLNNWYREQDALL